jgi:hypothetical protein
MIADWFNLLLDWSTEIFFVVLGIVLLASAVDRWRNGPGPGGRSGGPGGDIGGFGDGGDGGGGGDGGC